MSQIKKVTGVKIKGIGKYVPEMIADNEDFAKIVDTSDEWITQRTGIKTRHITNGEPTYWIGAKAAEKPLRTQVSRLKTSILSYAAQLPLITIRPPLPVLYSASSVLSAAWLWI